MRTVDRLPHSCSLTFQLMLLLAVLVEAATGALPVVYICGDSRVHDYQDNVANYIKSVATAKYIDCAIMKEVGDKAGSMKDGAIIYFSGGLDDFTCIAKATDPAMTPRIQTRLDSFKSSVPSTISKLRSNAPKAKLVMSTILGCVTCSQPNFPYRSDGYNQACDGTTCRRRRVDCKTFNSAAVALANAQNVQVQDMYKFTESYSFREPGDEGRHYADAEQAKMAAEIARLLKNLLATTTGPVELTEDRLAKTFVRSSRHSLEVGKLTAGQTVTLSDMSGRVVLRTAIGEDGFARIPLTSIPYRSIVFTSDVGRFVVHGAFYR